MTVNKNDLGRIVTEIAHSPVSDFGTWLEEAEIEEEGIIHMLETLKQTMVFCVEHEDFSVSDAIDSTILSSFQLGWSVHKQYGRSSERPTS